MTREGLIALIHEAFAGVTREGGRSWHEAEVDDDILRPTPEDYAMARARDTDQSWHEVAENPPWNPAEGQVAWNFLDPIGFRYYMPAGMIRTIDGEDNSLDFQFFLHPSVLAAMPTIFNREQLLVMSEFVLFMFRREEGGNADFNGNWTTAWQSHWKEQWHMLREVP